MRPRPWVRWATILFVTMIIILMIVIYSLPGISYF